MRRRTLDEMVSYINQQVSEMDIDQLYKIQLLGMISAIAYGVQKQRWIPCSKTTDIPDHEIMACDEYGEIMFGYLAYEDDQWICASDGYEMVDPIAWREKPEPWREEGD